MKIKVAGFPTFVAALVLASLACNALGSGALLQDDFAGSDKPWGTGTDADSSVQYSNDALNFVVNKDLYFVWSTTNAEFNGSQYYGSLVSTKSSKETFVPLSSSPLHANNPTFPEVYVESVTESMSCPST